MRLLLPTCCGLVEDDTAASPQATEESYAVCFNFASAVSSSANACFNSASLGTP